MFLKLYGGGELVERLGKFAKKRIKRDTVVPGNLFKHCRHQATAKTDVSFVCSREHQDLWGCKQID